MIAYPLSVSSLLWSSLPGLNSLYRTVFPWLFQRWPSQPHRSLEPQCLLAARERLHALGQRNGSPQLYKTSTAEQSSARGVQGECYKKHIHLFVFLCGVEVYRQNLHGIIYLFVCYLTIHTCAIFVQSDR